CRQGGISPSAPPRPKPQVQSVPPILRRQHQNSMPGYSKGAQGLSVYVRVTGIFTGTTDSPSALRRQCPNRYAIRAGRNLMFFHGCELEVRTGSLPHRAVSSTRQGISLDLVAPRSVGAGHFCRPLHVAMQSGLSLRADFGESVRLALSL